MLRHEKRFYCNHAGCSRAGRGFGTRNDLDRHRKSLHNLNSGILKSWKCKASRCEKPEKVWPRFDNFKQHVMRLHKDEHNGDQKQIDEILKRYRIHAPPVIGSLLTLPGLNSYPYPSRSLCCLHQPAWTSMSRLLEAILTRHSRKIEAPCP